jgi:anti-anti-sigma factor
MPLNAHFDQNDKKLVISVSGDFDFSLHQDFRKAYENVSASQIIVDLRNTEYMDSAALGMLLLLSEYYPGKSVSLRGCSDYIKELLQIAHFDKTFKIS